MSLKFTILALCLLTLTITAAGATTTIPITLGNMGAYGWTEVEVNRNGRVAVVNEKLAWGNPPMDSFEMRPEKSATGGALSWATISNGNYAGLLASQITHLTIRTFGLQGDTATDYQPATFLLAFRDTAGNQRFATWLNWQTASYPGNPRANGSADWVTYDAMTTGTWLITWTGGAYSSFADMVAANPDLTLMSDDEIAANYPLYPGRAFNVGCGNYYNGDRNYFSSTRGGVDFFEVGIDGQVTRWDCNKIPEPASFLALGTGLIGLVGIMRRRR